MRTFRLKALTAIFSLTTGIGLSQSPVINRRIDALMAAVSLEVQLGDYPAAWRTLELASKADPNSTKVHVAQEDVAMAWLENIHGRENENFSDIVKRLEPRLRRGVATAQSSSRQADLMAHIGWSDFLRSSDGSAKSDPARVYAEAVKVDPNNPYAQAMWGHWVLWNHGPLADAQPHFSLAVSTGRQRPFVRNLQLAALTNANDIAGSNYALIDYETIRVANEMRKEKVAVNPENQRVFLSTYYTNMRQTNKARFIRVVPPVEHLATFHWLFDGMALNKSKALLQTYYLSELEEAAGQREEALAGYRLVQEGMAGESGPLLDGAKSGIRRLTGKVK